MDGLAHYKLDTQNQQALEVYAQNCYQWQVTFEWVELGIVGVNGVTTFIHYAFLLTGDFYNDALFLL